MAQKAATRAIIMLARVALYEVGPLRALLNH